jgi:hypothetical protein
MGMIFTDGCLRSRKSNFHNNKKSTVMTVDFFYFSMERNAFLMI